MNLIKHLIKSYPITCLLVIFIWTMCFITPPATPLDNVRLIDKWVHIAMFAVLGMSVWFEYLRHNNVIIRARLTVYALILPSAMGGAIEIMQAYCTGGRRSGDILDFVADTIGVSIAFIFGILWVKYRARGRKDCD